MHLHDIAFYAAVFCLAGIFAASLGLSSVFVSVLTLFAIAIFLSVVFYSNVMSLKPALWLSGLALFVIAGALYAQMFVSQQSSQAKIDFNKKIKWSGTIIRYPEHGQAQNIVIDLRAPYSGKVLVRLKPYPQYSYGDVIDFEGKITRPEPEAYANYLAKEGIPAISVFPNHNRIGINGGSPLKKRLFGFKEKIIGTFNRILPAEEAAFLSGITLGEKGDFSQSLKDALSKSGTTHLVALSGYNISIIGWAIRNSLGRFLARRMAFFLTTGIILGFVLMTGAEASAVRAGIMGTIILFSGEVGRMYGFRNAIVLTAFVMAFQNPLIVRFDVGFQLSFLALLGLIYVSPFVKKILHLEGDPGFLSWRENLAATLGAQLAVLPLLVIYFNNFSPLSIISNVLVLEVVPVLMGIGFASGAIAFISSYLAAVIGWLLHPMLLYVLGIIRLFGNINLPSFISPAGVAGVIVYYSALMGIPFVFYMRKKSLLKSDRDRILTLAASKDEKQ